MDKDVDSGNNEAVKLMGGESQKLVLNPGAGSFTGTVNASRDDAVLELAGAAGTSGSLALTELADFTNFVNFDKIGAGTWTLTGVLGVSAGREWSGGEARGSFHASADLLLPLDGDTGSSVAGVSLSNRLQDPVLDLGARASWKWGDRNSVYGEVGTAQGGEPRSIAPASASDSASDFRGRASVRNERKCGKGIDLDHGR